MQLRELKNKWGSNITDYDPTATLLNKFKKELAKLPKKESLIPRYIAKFQSVKNSAVNAVFPVWSIIELPNLQGWQYQGGQGAMVPLTFLRSKKKKRK